MILGDSSPDEIALARIAGRATLDEMFGRTLARTPDALAFCDGPGRARMCDGAPLRLTYAQADAAITAIAGQLRALGLPTDSVVALQLPNTVEFALSLLGVLRAGLIAAPVPLLWRRAEMAPALARIGARAIIAGRRAGTTDTAEVAAEVAAETFTVRAVCAFGEDLPDGVVPLDPLLTGAAAAEVAAFTPVERPVNPAVHVAVVTFECDVDGPVPVARNHVELLAGGVAVVLEARLQPGGAIVSTIQPSSFAGLATGLVPALMLGAPLALHLPFDPGELRHQLADLDARAVVVPGPLALRLRESGVLSQAAGLTDVIALWRAPERLAASPDWPTPGPGLVDVQVLGELGLIPGRRGADGRPAAVGIGPVTAPRGAPGASLVAELARTEQGSLALRGAMVPRFAFPPGAERGSAPFLKLEPNLYADSRQPCRIDKESGGVTVTAPPPGLVGIGGYRLALARLDQLIEEISPAATLLAVPDAVMGQRLFGQAVDAESIRHTLVDRGENPLLVGAFRERRAVQPEAA